MNKNKRPALVPDEGKKNCNVMGALLKVEWRERGVGGQGRKPGLLSIHNKDDDNITPSVNNNPQ